MTRGRIPSPEQHPQSQNTRRDEQRGGVSFRTICSAGQSVPLAIEACLPPATCAAQSGGKTACEFPPTGDATAKNPKPPSCPSGHISVDGKCRLVCQLYSCPTASWYTVGLLADCKPIQCTLARPSQGRSRRWQAWQRRQVGADPLADLGASPMRRRTPPVGPHPSRNT